MGSGPSQNPAGPSMILVRTQPWLVLSIQVPGQSSTPGAISSQLTMWSLKSFLCFSMAVTCVYALMFTSLRDKAEEIQWKMLCGGHILIWQNLQDEVEKKKEKSSFEEDYMFHTLTLLEMYLVKFVSSVRNLKLIISNCGNHNPFNVEVPADLGALGQ
nr:protein FAM209B-like [Bubalus bubalis]